MLAPLNAHVVYIAKGLCSCSQGWKSHYQTCTLLDSAGDVKFSPKMLHPFSYPQETIVSCCGKFVEIRWDCKSASIITDLDAHVIT